VEPDHFFSQFDDILVCYRNGKADLASAKKDLLNLFERHSDDPTGKEIGFDLSRCDPSIKSILSEVVEEFQSRFFGVGSIFAKLTSKGQEVMILASQCARANDVRSLMAEHLLVGLLDADSALVERFLSPGDTFGNIRDEIGAQSSSQENQSSSQEINLSHESLTVFQFAQDEAERLSHSHVDTGDLLLGLLRSENSSASTILARHGFELSKIRDTLR